MEIVLTVVVVAAAYAMQLGREGKETAVDC